jgi:phage-related minor tail protein
LVLKGGEKMADESTTKIKMDISDLKRSMTEARRQIRLANAEFKASSAGMDNWAKSADGLSAKMNQLRSTLSAEKSILNDLNKQYELTVQSQGKNSKGAQELLIKIKNQEAAINKTKAALEKYGRMMNELEKESSQAANGADDMRSAYEKLSDTISKQESDLQSLKSKYSSIVLEQGKTSDEAQKLANEISQLSGELAQNKSKMSNAANAADDLDKSLDKAGDAAENSSDGFTIMKGAIADLVADGIKGAITALKEFATESDQAYNKFQAQTGASSEEMQGFKKEMDDLYNNAYGESLEDVGDKMAYIKQVTGETDPSKIKELAENAMTLEDTFGSDFNETLRGVQNLMTHFGLSAEEAFDLFAKGSQEGLDYTDELGDNVAEYGGNFKQAGYSAQEYFQLLANGTKNGAYNLDKVNDSINEVKNRLGDGTIGKNISMFSKDTETAFKAWESGKGTMKDVIDSIVNDINGCTDEQKALNMAATAFGTMGEDANLKVIKSLTTTGDTFKNVKGTMEEVKDVRYDDIGTQFTEIGRKLQTEFLQPLAQKALPGIKSFVQYVITNMNSIVPVVAAVGTALGTMFVASKVLSFIQTLQKAAIMFGLVSTATNVATGSTLAFNAAMLANPITLAVAGIAALTAGIVGYVVKTKLSTKSVDENTQATNNLISKQKELNSTLKESNKTRQSNITSAQEEGAQADIYFDRLNKLIGVEKKSSAQKALIKDYVEKLNAIMPDLNLKYDEEKDKLNQSTQAIKNNISAQKEMILAKAAQANLQTIASDMVKVETQQGELIKQNTKNETAYTAAQEKTRKAREAYIKSGYNQYSQEYHNYIKALQNEGEKREAYEKTSAAVEKNEKKLKSLNSEYDKTEKYAQSKINSAEIEKSLSAITEKMKAKGKEIPKAISDGIKSGQYQVPTTIAGMENLIKFDKLAKQAKVDGVKIPKSLAEGISSGKVSAQDAVNRLKEATKFDNSKTVADAKNAGIKIPKSLREGILSGKTSAEEAGKELAKAVSKGQKDGSKDSKSNGQKSGKDYSSGVNSQAGKSKKSGQNVGKSGTTGMKNGGKNSKKTGQSAGKNYASGVGSQSGKAKSSGQKIGKSADSGAKSGGKGSKSTGQKLGSDYASGVGSKAGSAKTKGESLGKSAKSGAGSVSAESSGENFAQGFINGIGSLVGSAWDAAKKLAQKAWDGLKEGQKEGSPSKLTKQSGVYFGEGYNNGIKSMTKEVMKSSAGIAKSAYNSLRTAQQEGSPSKLTYKSGKYFTQGFINGISSEQKNLVKTVKNMVTTVVNTMKNLDNFNFSEVGSNASTLFSDAMSKQITYMTNKMQYQNDQKTSELEKKLSSAETKRDTAQKNYDKAKSNYDKAKSKKQKAKKAKDKKKYNNEMKKYQKQMKTYDKQIKQYKTLVSEQTEFNNAYQSASAQMISEFNDAMNQYQTKAQDLIDDTINGITDTYQAKYDALIDKQDNLISKLKSAGDLFEISNAGIMTVNDIKAQTQGIRDYTNKLQTIKSKVSSELFDQIASYDMDEGNAFMDRLLSMSDADLKAYSDAYDEKMRVSEEAAEKVYSKDFDNVAKEYKDSLNEAFKDLPKQLEKLGQQVMAGFTTGLTKDTDYMTKAIKTMVQAMVDEFKDQLDIHSPSKVTEKLGIFTGQGFGNGLLDSIRQVQKNAKEFISGITTPLTDMTANLGNMRSNIKGSMGNGIATSNQTIVNNYNLVQNNTSPKSLSALDTYRARRQQVSMVKAMTQPI